MLDRKANLVAAVALVAAAVIAAPLQAAGATPQSKPGFADSRVRTAVEAFRSRLSTHAEMAPRTATGTKDLVPRMSVRDRAGDAASAHGDITGAGFAQDQSHFTFGMTVASATDPTRDVNWRNGRALAAWVLDTNGDSNSEYVVGMLAVPHGRLLALMASLSNFRVCIGAGSYVAHSGYRATFAKSCVRPGLWFRFQAAMTYPSGRSDDELPIDVAPDEGASPPHVVRQVAGQSGYWTLDSNGRAHAFGGADGFVGSVAGATAVAPRTDGTGYWVVDRVGHVFAYGTAGFFGGSPALVPGEYISTISPTVGGRGYWLFSDRGRVFAFGNADTYGDMSQKRLNGRIVASVATPTGRGYYMVGSDGGIFTFGDARFRGSAGGRRLNAPIVGIAPTPDRKGYWLVAADGGVFAFSAPFRGSMGGVWLNEPVVGIAAYGNGYLVAASDGGVFTFSDKPFSGSSTNSGTFTPVIAIAAFAT